MPRYDSPPYHSVNTTFHDNGTDQGQPSPASKGGQGLQNRPTSPPIMFNPFFTGRPRTPLAFDGHSAPVDRQEIIRKLKRAEQRRSTSPVEHEHVEEAPPPPTQVRETRNDSSASTEEQNALGLHISRPRSALHRGDFREEDASSPWSLDGHNLQHDPSREWQPPPSTSPVVPWHRDFPVSAFHQTPHESPSPMHLPFATPPRSRALSHASLSTSFVYQPPTSPLVYQANAADIPDQEPLVASRQQHSPDRASRRRTHSPRLLQQSRSAFDSLTYQRAEPPSHASSLRRESTFPYQAHQPRRSIGSLQSLTQPSWSTARRPSMTDASPLQHAPMVGSYEESILRGRMSTTPSKPLNFVAQIGVLGKGDCKPSLKCPPHVTIPFPAVFYSYPSALAVDPEPSPYVGMIDLENTLQKAPERDDKRSRENERQPSQVHEDDMPGVHTRKRKHRSKRSHSPKEPHGGCYRIPQIGQLQIVLKNPNKTAVKLFLVPYDLSDMEPGQKTFIRQRSYSAGPMIDMPVTSRSNHGTDRPEAALSPATDPRDRPILRYLIHLHICSPSKNRFYLYQHIRVVFANRVPDGKEKLRSEIQMPEPRYSAYKPGRESNAFQTSASMDNARRRRSAIYPAMPAAASSSQHDHLRHDHHLFDHVSPFEPSAYGSPYGTSLFGKSFDNMSYDLPRIQRLPTLESRPGSRDMHGNDDDADMKNAECASPTSSVSSRPHVQRQYGLRIGHKTRIRSSDGGDGIREQDDRADQINPTLTFSRETSRDRVTAHGSGAESLLSRKLRDLEMRSSSVTGGVAAAAHGDLDLEKGNEFDTDGRESSGGAL